MKSRLLVNATWPVVTLVLPPKIDEAFVRELESGFREIFARQKPFALITETRCLVELPKPRERKLLTDWAGRADELVNQRAWNVGSSTIVPNAVMRSVLQAIYWVWTPPAPQHSARDLSDGAAWCIAQLAANGIKVPYDAASLAKELTALIGPISPSGASA